MTAQGPHRERRVTYYLPGSFFAEDTTRAIDDGPDIVQRAAAEAPAGVFCFELLTVIVAPAVPDGEGGALAVVPKVVARSGRFYPAGRLFDVADLRIMGGHAVLLANMECNRWPFVILTGQGNWQPFNDGDVLLTADGPVTCDA